MKFEATLPFPPSALKPCCEDHAKAKREYRASCWWSFIRYGAEEVKVPEGELALWLEVYPPDGRKRDDDNMIAAFDAARAGLAEALGVDKSCIHVFPRIKIYQRGVVYATVTELPKP